MKSKVVKEERHSLIGDSGVVEKFDLFSHLVKVFSIILIILLIYLGIRAIIY